MNQREQQIQRNSEILKKYIPEFAVPTIAQWILEFDFKLKILEKSKNLYKENLVTKNDIIILSY